MSRPLIVAGRHTDGRIGVFVRQLFILECDNTDDAIMTAQLLTNMLEAGVQTAIDKGYARPVAGVVVRRASLPSPDTPK